MPDVHEGLVSTVIPVFNREHELVRAVDSVLAQTWRPIEIIISDDGSTDGTADVAASLVMEHPGIVHYLKNENRGPGPAREAGRQRVRGEFVQYLDSDDVLLPEKFALQVAALRARPDCGVAYGWTRLLGSELFDPDEPAKWTGREIETLFPGLLVDRWWCTVSPLYRRAITDAVGSWSSLRYSQDWEYDARVGALGTRLAYVPEFVAEQHHHEGIRQTGHGRWLDPAAMVQFFDSLATCSGRAGVAPDAPEMTHFSRWVFSQARACALADRPEEAAALFELARSCVPRSPMDLRLFGQLGRLFGWKTATRVLEALRRVGGSNRHTDTLRQSWMRS